MTKPNFGFSDVVLNSERYYAAFADPKHFERPGELAWMLWQPPAAVANMDEWFEVHRSIGAGGMPKAESFARLVLLSSIRLGDGAMFASGAREAFLSVIENVNEGNLEALEASMHRSTYNYIKGWIEYMKKHGYTWKHTVEEVLKVQPSGATLISTFGRKKPTKKKDEDEEAENDADNEEDVPPLQYTYDPHSSIVGDWRESLLAVSAFSWAKITAREKFEIVDAKGSTVLSSPSKVCHHIWKFGANSTIPGRQFDDMVKKYKGKELPEKLKGQWEFKLFDIDNQVIQRAADIIHTEKVFLDADASKTEVWQLTRAF